MPKRFYLFVSLFWILWLAAAMAETGNSNGLYEDFRNPPPGYGEVPFWWWTGERLDSERLIWELDELHKMGISGVQINYAHRDQRPWLTYPNDPEIFTPEWWKVYDEVAAACAERKMGIGLSGYTIDWQEVPGNLFSKIVYNCEETLSRNLSAEKHGELDKGKSFSVPILKTGAKRTAAILFYPHDAEGLPRYADGVNLLDAKTDWAVLGGETVSGTAPESGELWSYITESVPNTLNPLHPESGRRVIDNFFQPFEDHSPTKSAEGLNYFFQDELQIGTGALLWHDDLPAEFQKRKGYSLYEALPVFFEGGVPFAFRGGEKIPADKDEETRLINQRWAPAVKYRLDYFDVRVRLAEERYFIPIFDWHASRGLIYACDPASRGYNPFEFCDYFSAIRWYTAPGHDTPNGYADFIKNRVSSSIAHFYHRPRVWLEGYHSLGWGATPERIFQATCENFIYGANLLNLHGLYYSTYGGWWEWAPPCYHFRMPYWRDFGGLLRYFERLSWLMSRGDQKADILIYYPVSEYQGTSWGRMKTESGAKASEYAFEAAKQLAASRYNILFADDDSIARGEAKDGKLFIDGKGYRLVILPNLSAVRWSVFSRLREFHAAGGKVIALNQIPAGSDRAGTSDPCFDEAAAEIFADSESVLRAEPSELGSSLTALVEKTIPRDVTCSDPGIRIIFQHRVFEDRDIYVVMGPPKGTELTFRAAGKAEYWNPWTGEVQELFQVRHTESTTEIVTPKGAEEAQVFVFTRGEKPRFDAVTTDLDDVETISTPDALSEWRAVGMSETPGPKSMEITAGGKTVRLTGTAPVPPAFQTMDGVWESEIVPTLDNRYGDFRLPIEEEYLGAEARRLETLRVTGDIPAALKSADWSRAETFTCGFGPKFLRLDPLPDTLTAAEKDELDRLLSSQSYKPASVSLGDKEYGWNVYAFSWREGIEGNPGHEGYHGLKKMVDDRFIGLGTTGEGLNETLFEKSEEGNIHYLLTWVNAEPGTGGEPVRIETEGEFPDAVRLGGKPISAETPLKYSETKHPLLLRFDTSGRRGFVLVRSERPEKAQEPTPLSMRWFEEPGRLDFDPFGNETDKGATLYRFLSPPGLQSAVITAKAPVRVFSGETEFRVVPVQDGSYKQEGLDGGQRYRVEFDGVKKAREIVLAAETDDARSGEFFPEPIRLECGLGEIALGDWNEMGTLAFFSGGIRYRHNFTLSREEANSNVLLDLGGLCASARVTVNGREAGTLVTPPWQLDISKAVQEGENLLEIEVRNTLSNHYRTIPTRYRGDSPSGLFGPVQLRFIPKTELRSIE